MPPPFGKKPEIQLSEGNILQIIRTCGPREWQQTQVRANLRALTCNKQAQYFEGLLLMDKKSNNNNKRRNRGNCNNNNNNGNSNGRGNENNNNNPNGNRRQR